MKKVIGLVLAVMLYGLSYGGNAVKVNDGLKGYIASDAELNSGGAGNTLSLMGWMKMPNSGNIDCFLSIASNLNTPAFTLWYWHENSGRDRIFMKNSGNATALTATLPKDQWFHLAITSDSANKGTQLYINGSLISGSITTFTSQNSVTNAQLFLGRYHGSDTASNTGRGNNYAFDEITVWSGPLTAAQITAGYNNGLGTAYSGTEANLQLYWTLDEGSGKVLSDSSTTDGKDIDGAINGTAGTDFTWIKDRASATPATPAPTAPTAVKADAFTASWSPVNLANSYDFTYSTASDFSNAVTVNTTSTSLTINKASNVTYYYKVRAKNTNGSSNYSTVKSAFKYAVLSNGDTESFDNDGKPEGWATVDVNGGNSWQFLPPDSSSYRPADADGKYASCKFDKPNNDWLITPPVKIGTKGSTLTFKGYHAYRTGNSGSPANRKFKVKVALASHSQTTTDANYKQVFAFDGIHSNSDFEVFTVDIKEADGIDFKGKEVYVAFQYDGNDGRALSIDDVKFKQLNAPTTTPAVGLTLSLNDGQLTWQVKEEKGVKAYEVYIGGRLFDTVKAGGIASYTLKVPSGKVVLKVVDLSGHSKSYIPANSNLVTELYSLNAGWNLIAVTSDNADLSTLKDKTSGMIWGWNGSSYQLVNSVKATEAAWIYSPKAQSLSVKGIKSNASITLNPGWNMVGPTVTIPVPDGADTVYSWSSVYDIITDHYSVLEQGKGYWIFVR